MVALHFVLVFLIPLLAGFALACLVRLYRLRQAGRFARKLVEKGEGGIQGRVGMAGTGVEVERRPKRRAAVSRWTCHSRMDSKFTLASSERPEKLWITTGRGDVELRGPVEVFRGSRASWRTLSREYERLRSVDAGDTVYAIGKLVEAEKAPEDDPGHYRNKASRRQLEPLAEGDAIRLVYVGAPSPFDRRLLLHPAVVLLFLLLLRLPYTALTDYSQTRQSVGEVCRRYGLCHIVPRWRVDGWLALFKGEITGKHFTAVALDDRDCNQSWSCEDSGECSASGGKCTVGSDRDCRSSWACDWLGQCSDMGGICQRGNAECSASHDCAQLGACSSIASRSGDARYCGAANDADCRRSQGCSVAGDCKAVGGECVATTTSCRHSEGCLEEGRCSARKGRCVVASDEDCRWSTVCRDHGMCQPVKGSCVNLDKDCRHSAQCRVHGMCAGGKGACHADSEHDCQASLGCKQRGMCRLIDGKCRKSCADDVDCRDNGLCSEVDGDCVARGDDCRKSGACALLGLCTARGGKCVAGSDADCRASIACRESGYCTARKGGCLLTSDADCQLTDECRRSGRCSLKHGMCEVSDAGCRRLRACKEFGRCSVGEQGVECRVKSDADCKRSAVCKERGWCKLGSDPDDEEAACFGPPELASGA